MKRKIIAGLCGGAMAAVSCFAFAGCGGREHKHVYKDYYELADCTDMGYTLHCCTECDYMYADDFVMPYGHAHEHCVNFAVPVAAAKAAAYSRGSFAGKAENISVENLPMCSLISDPLCEISASQKTMLEQYGLKLLDDMFAQKDPSDKVITFAFEQIQCPFCGDYKEKVYSLSVPLLATVPIPHFDMGSAELQFSMDLKPDVGSGAFDGAETRTVSVASHDSAPSAASVPTQYQLSADGELTYDTKVDAADLIKNDNEQPLQLIMADSIEEIDANAFISCTELKRAELPSALKKIGANAFGASKLDYVIIPSGLKNIGDNAFGDCKNMKYLFYCGTQEDFNGITFENANDAVKSVPRYYYSEETPTADGNFWRFVDGKPEIW